MLGSHEDDVYMTDGASGIAEQISVGFIEVQDDFVQRLPGFLQAYDAVVLGKKHEYSHLCCRSYYYY